MKSMPLFSQSVLTAILTITAMSPAMAENQNWESLFNGRDLAGWVAIHENEFEVRDGNLRLVKGMGWIRTEKEYSDFIIEFETRALVEDYDSGLFFRSGEAGKPWPDTGFQMNLKHNDLGSLVQQYTLRIKSPAEKVALGEWMKFRLAVKGKSASAYLNGRHLWTADFIEPARGYLGIQTENRAFDFRNLRVHEIRD